MFNFTPLDSNGVEKTRRDLQKNVSFQTLSFENSPLHNLFNWGKWVKSVIGLDTSLLIQSWFHFHCDDDIFLFLGPFSSSSYFSTHF